MKFFDGLLYDPKKFIVSAVVLLWIMPLFIVGLINLTANAMTTNMEGGCTDLGSRSANSNYGGCHINTNNVSPQKMTCSSSASNTSMPNSNCNSNCQCL